MRFLSVFRNFLSYGSRFETYRAWLVVKILQFIIFCLIVEYGGAFLLSQVFFAAIYVPAHRTISK
jgi:hypothetical protein